MASSLFEKLESYDEFKRAFTDYFGIHAGRLVLGVPSI
jgi:hypothetical protein